jgi:hypothetical protein
MTLLIVYFSFSSLLEALKRVRPVAARTFIYFAVYGILQLVVRTVKLFRPCPYEEIMITLSVLFCLLGTYSMNRILRLSSIG